VEMGLQIVLRGRPDRMVKAKPAPRNRLIAVAIGSDQGMCGQLNEQLAAFALDALTKANNEEDHRIVLAVGAKVASSLDERGLEIREVFAVPGSVHGIVHLVQDLLTKVEEWQARLNLDHVVVFHNRHISNTTFVPHQVRLLPVDLEWLKRLQRREWPCRTIPTFTMEWDRLFSALIWQYLFISLYRAVSESLASENAARLASMERAEKNIRERLDELSLYYHQCRQLTITEELLDIVSGFEALTGPQDGRGNGTVAKKDPRGRIDMSLAEQRSRLT
jgi:F-type H+-transporting ATPase subunit gamma